MYERDLFYWCVEHALRVNIETIRYYERVRLMPVWPGTFERGPAPARQCGAPRQDAVTLPCNRRNGRYCFISFTMVSVPSTFSTRTLTFSPSFACLIIDASFAL